MLLQAGAVLHGICDVQKPMDMLPELVKNGWVSVDESTEIAAGIALFKDIQQIARLAFDGPIPAENIGDGFSQLLVNVTGVRDIAELENKLADLATKLTQIVVSKL